MMQLVVTRRQHFHFHLGLALFLTTLGEVARCQWGGKLMYDFQRRHTTPWVLCWSKQKKGAPAANTPILPLPVSLCDELLVCLFPTHSYEFLESKSHSVPIHPWVPRTRQSVSSRESSQWRFLNEWLNEWRDWGRALGRSKAKWNFCTLVKGAR